VSSNNPRSEGVASGRAGISVAFGQAMTGVKTRCGQLAALITAHDFDGVEYTAREAANMWLTGRAACRRFIQRSEASSPYADAARGLLEENYMMLLELFERATCTIDVPRMRRALRELRSTLMVAMAHPLSGESVETPPVDRSKRR
jgi:hypothetical protein